MSPQMMNGKPRLPFNQTKLTRSSASSNNQNENYRGNCGSDSSGLSFLSSKSKAFRCRFFVNGDKHFNGIYYVINLDRLRTLDSLCTELSRILVDVKSLPSGVRIIFNCEDGTKIDSIEQFNHNENYVCSSNDHFIRLDYCSIRLTPPLLLNSSQMNHSHQDHFQDEGAINSNCEMTNYENTKKSFMRSGGKKLTTKNGNNNNINNNNNNLTNYSNDSNSSSQTLSTSTRTTLSPNSFVTLRPKLVALLRGSCRAEPSMRPSRRVFRFLLNHRIAQNYEQLLNEISKCVKLNVGAVHRVYGLYSKKINCLSDFYDNESVYLVYGRSEKCNLNDFLLDDYEQREIASIIGTSYLNIFYQEMGELHNTNRMYKKDSPIKRTVKICDDINNNISTNDETNSLQISNINQKKYWTPKDTRKDYYPSNNLKNRKNLNENNDDIKANSLPASFCKNIEPQYDCDNIQDCSISSLIEPDKEKIENSSNNEVKPLEIKNTVKNFILNRIPNKNKKIIVRRKIFSAEKNNAPLTNENDYKEMAADQDCNILLKNDIDCSIWERNNSDYKKNAITNSANKINNASIENNFQNEFCSGRSNCLNSDSNSNLNLVFEKSLLNYSKQNSNATNKTSNCNLIKSNDNLSNFSGNIPGATSSISCFEDFCFVSGNNSTQNENCNYDDEQINSCTNFTNSPIAREVHSFSKDSDSDDSSPVPSFSSLSDNISINKTVSFSNETDLKSSNDEDEDIEVSYVLKSIDNINNENKNGQTASNVSEVQSNVQNTSFSTKQQNKFEYLNVTPIGNHKNINLAPKLTQIPPSTKFQPKKEVNEVYFVDKLIGDGKFGVVYTCIHRATRHSYALKVVDKYMMKQVLFNQNEDEATNSEVEILTRVDHPNIVKLYQHFDYVDESYLVLELLQGGDLFDAISVASKYGESEAATMITDLLSALNYLHQLNIVHRDVKLENLLVFYETINCKKSNRSISNDGGLQSVYNTSNQFRQYRRRVKLADFGLAVEIKNNEKLFTVCGTPTYVAPEILLEVGYSFPVDIWAAGVILFILLSGVPPFVSDENDQAQLFDQIISGKFEFSINQWRSVSDNAKRMIQSMLCVHQSKRITARQLLNHVWINNFNSSIN